MLVLPKGEFAGQMAGHAKHNESPSTSLYVPEEHRVHGPPSGPEKPRIQPQSVLPGDESVFAGHFKHAVAALELINFPAAHGEHSAVADELEYEPAWHSMQTLFAMFRSCVVAVHRFTTSSQSALLS